MPRQIGAFGDARQLQPDAPYVLLKAGVVVQAHLLPDLLIGLLPELDLLRLAHQGDLFLSRGGIGGACGHPREQRQDEEGDTAPHAAD